MHYNDVIMGVMASQIPGLTSIYSAAYSGVDQRKHQRSPSLALVRGIHRWPLNSPRKWPVRAHLHQRGAGPPAGAGSVFRAGRVFTLARVRTQFHFTGAPFRGTGSLIYKYRPISASYSCGSRRGIAPWAISAAGPPRRQSGFAAV